MAKKKNSIVEHLYYSFGAQNSKDLSFKEKCTWLPYFLKDKMHLDAIHYE